MAKAVGMLGHQVIKVSKSFRTFFHFVTEIMRLLFQPPYRRVETIQQIYIIGVQSAPVILFCISFAAAVTILEYSYHMKLVLQTDALVPGFAALLVLRELGVVITALLLSSRVGAGMTAEVATMKITEQIEALQLLHVHPVKYLVLPRLVASVLSNMVLVVLANATCLFFSMLVSIYFIGISPELFLNAMNRFTSFQDFGLSIIKAAVFGAVIPIVSCFYGFHCKGGAEGVGQATTQAVVTNAVSIIIIDFILTYLFSYLY